MENIEEFKKLQKQNIEDAKTFYLNEYEWEDTENNIKLLNLLHKYRFHLEKDRVENLLSLYPNIVEMFETGELSNLAENELQDRIKTMVSEARKRK